MFLWNIKIHIFKAEIELSLHISFIKAKKEKLFIAHNHSLTRIIEFSFKRAMKPIDSK